MFELKLDYNQNLKHTTTYKGLCMYYRKITSSNTSRLEAHVGLFRLLMKGIFGPYVL